LVRSLNTGKCGDHRLPNSGLAFKPLTVKPIKHRVIGKLRHDGVDISGNADFEH